MRKKKRNGKISIRKNKITNMRIYESIIFFIDTRHKIAFMDNISMSNKIQLITNNNRNCIKHFFFFYVSIDIYNKSIINYPTVCGYVCGFVCG